MPLVPLREARGLLSRLSAVVDQDDLARVLEHTWRARYHHSGKVYAETAIGGRTVSLHRFVLSAPVSIRIDHRDTNGLNNRRNNLRPATNSQNLHNQSGHRDRASSRFKGVFFDKSKRKFRAQIMVDYKKTYLGTFDLEEDAAVAYDSAARRLHGEFARTNFDEVRV